jgi:fido (protein-threonine AMPylation protein)
MSKKEPATLDVLDNNHKFLMKEIYHSLEWIKNENRPHGKEFYLVPLYQERALNYALNSNDMDTYKEIIGNEFTKEFIEVLPRASFKELVY